MADEPIKYIGSEGLGNTSEERVKNLKKCKPKKLKVEIDNKHLLKGFDELPFFYIDGKNTHIFWMCNRDQEGRITSVYKNTDPSLPRGTPSKFIGYINTMEEAINIRNQLILDGWVEGQMPEITADMENWKAIPKKKKKRIIRQLTQQAIREEKDKARKERLKSQLKRKGKDFLP
jgi:hypothetical protein